MAKKFDLKDLVSVDALEEIMKNEEAIIIYDKDQPVYEIKKFAKADRVKEDDKEVFSMAFEHALEKYDEALRALAE